VTRLSGPRIAAQALAILDRDGVDGFSMRKIARSLNVTPMALYHHVGGKAELAALVIEAAHAEYPYPAPVDAWQENLWFIADWTRRCALAHPAVLDLRRTYDVWTSDFHILADRWMGSWQQSGLGLELAVQAATTSSAAVSGLVTLELGQGQQRYVPSNRELPHLPNADVLLGTVGDPAQIFELGVHSVIEGIHARLLREQEVLAAAPPSRKTSRKLAAAAEPKRSPGAHKVAIQPLKHQLTGRPA
jgi:AcrR family transcriptional regulator